MDSHEMNQYIHHPKSVDKIIPYAFGTIIDDVRAGVIADDGDTACCALKGDLMEERGPDGCRNNTATEISKSSH